MNHNDVRVILCPDCGVDEGSTMIDDPNNQCDNFCLQIKTIPRYSKGVRYCKYCDVFIKVEGVTCPCCSHKTRGRRADSTSLGVKDHLRY